MEKREKIVTNYLYEGLGMPIILSKVKICKVRGEWLPEIDVEELSEKVFKNLPAKLSKLTGNEIRFIRTYLGKSRPAFGNLFKLSHTSIAKWESSENEPAPISPSQEMVLRLYLEDYLQVGLKEFYKAYKSIESSVFLEDDRPLKVAL